MIENFFINNNFLSILIFLSLVAFSVLLSDFLKARKKGIELEVLRKIPHILIGVIFSLSPFFMNKNEIIFSATILFLGVWVGKYLPFFKTVFSIKRITYGMWLTPISLGIMSFLWLPDSISTFLFGISVLTFSDAFAALAGKILKGNKIPFLKKTFEGSAAFFLTTTLLLFILSPEIKFWNFLLVSGILTILEMILIFGLDNLFLPIIAAFLFNYLIV